MRKLLAAGALCAGLFVAGAAQPELSAQPTKGAKGVAGSFVIGKGKDGKFRFSVRDAEDKYLAGSVAYESEKECRDAIEAFKKVVAGAKVTMKAEKK